MLRKEENHMQNTASNAAWVCLLPVQSQCLPAALGFPQLPPDANMRINGRDVRYL